MTMFRVPGIALAMALLLGPSARAEELRICFEEWEPFSAVVDGRPAGLMINIMDRALASAGHSAVYSQQPYRRCIGNVRSGRYDAMLMTSGEPGLAPTSVSVAFWEVGVLAGPDWPTDSYASLDDFAGATVGLVGAYDYHPAVRAVLPRWQVEYAPEAIFNLRKLSSGRIDLTIADVPWALIRAAREGLSVKVLSPLLFATPQRTYFRPDLDHLVASVDEALRALIADGTVDLLYERAVGLSFGEVSARARNTLTVD